MYDHDADAPLVGRVAVVTGASSGIGAAVAELLAARGAAVGLLARRGDRLEQVARRITAVGGRALPLPVDVTDPDALREAAGDVEQRFGPASVLVPAAGALRPGSLTEVSRDRWETEISTNIVGFLHTLDAFGPHLKRAARQGEVTDLVAFSSVAAMAAPMVMSAVYAATKAFVSHLMRTVREELDPHGIRACCVAPGLVRTELHPSEMRGLLESVKTLTPQEIAELIVAVVTLPPQVGMTEVTVVPTGQPALPG